MGHIRYKQLSYAKGAGTALLICTNKMPAAKSMAYKT